jgi:hypothetical protein
VTGRRSSRTGRVAHRPARPCARLRRPGALREAADCDTEFVERPAAAVKPRATDTRLDRAGLLAPTRGMPHARSAARHALYAAVPAGLLADPLSDGTTQ